MKKKINICLWLSVVLVVLTISCRSQIGDVKQVEETVKTDSVNATENDTLKVPELTEDVRVPLDFTSGKTITKSYIDTTTGDTVYVDFTFEFEDEKYSGETRQEKYYIIAPYPVYVLTKDVVDELKRWQELEEETFLDAFDKGKNNLFYIALRKVRTQEEAIKEWKELKAKYPDAKLNFHQVSRTVPIEE